MKLVNLALVGMASAAAVLDPRGGYGPPKMSSVIRKDSELLLDGKRWTFSGANVYWLGLDENVIPPPGQPFYAPFNASYPTFGRITEVMNILNTMGARTIRSQTLGVSVGNPLSLMPALGKYNEQAFRTMDWAIAEAGRTGIRIFAPLVDNYDYYHGGKFNFLRFRGIDIQSKDPAMTSAKVLEFYNNPVIVGDFKNYITKLLTHRNQFNGLTYAEDPTIFAYETGNELGGPVFGDKNVPKKWVAEIAAHVKTLAPKKLFIDGTYGVNPTHLDLKDVDIYSDHFYAPRNISKLQAEIAMVGAANKVYVAAEYDWRQAVEGPTLQQFLDVILTQSRKPKPIIMGDQFWSLFGHNVPDCNSFVQHGDGFTLHYNDPTNPANVTQQIRTIRKHLFAMQGKTVGNELPPAECPGGGYGGYGK